MFKSTTRHWHATTLAAAASVALLALAATTQADAACMKADSLLLPKAAIAQSGQFVPAVYVPDGGARLMPVGDYEDGESIAGLWQFKTHGFSEDWGTQAWHSDGTEIMFSGGQNPETGDVCQGVWRRIGPSTYTLNHIAMGWLAPGGPFGIRVHFHMIVRLSASGDSFTGTYKAAVYSVSPANPFDESVQVASGTGTVTASRVKPD
jgi:hypothetical protein